MSAYAPASILASAAAAWLVVAYLMLLFGADFAAVIAVRLAQALAGVAALLALAALAVRARANWTARREIARMERYWRRRRQRTITQVVG